ncbi:MAG: ABC transporter ATP-binding protein [bacterium]
MSKVRLKNLCKVFGSVPAVRDLNLDIGQGEFFSLLGPSGCGKTTTLRMIAGFEIPSSGQILFDGEDVTFRKPNQRNTGMVFQNFALFPHMTVFENVAFGLQARKAAKQEIKTRVLAALELVELENLDSRSVTQLSGGQQQRVALTRAIVIEPNILLLDEPLSNLDAKLREETREEIKSLQRRLRITTIYVTHDQDEALSLSDRIAVMQSGVCQQVGSPEDIYRRPANRFVAEFVGNSNILPARVLRTGKDKSQVEIHDNWRLEVATVAGVDLSSGRQVYLSVRPENIAILNGDSKRQNVFTGEIKNIRFSGAVIGFEIAVNSMTLKARALLNEAGFHLANGSKVRFQIHPSQIHILP